MNQIRSAEGRFATNLLAGAALLGLLYVGRAVLIPVSLAIFLSLIVNPAVRLLQRARLGHAVAVVLVVLGLFVVIFALLGVLGAQLVHLARHLPTYEVTIQAKVKVIRELTQGRLDDLQSEIGRALWSIEGTGNAGNPGVLANKGNLSTAGVAQGAATSFSLAQLASSAWPPIQTAGIMVVVLGFVLLEQESLRDRFIRLVGGTDLRATTEAIHEAAQRLSRYFLSTFSINLGVGVTLWVGLSLIGIPNAALWAALTALLRFVPYVGVWAAAALCAVFAMAVDPGWSLVLLALALYVCIEFFAAQVVEPMLYGHATGLSPLAVVVATIFWSWLWGPVGLILSTPLTLCLLVAGRYVEPLGKLNILLGDTPALTLPQRFYQRALSGDSVEIVAAARAFLKRKSFASYADAVLLPALQLSRIDLERKAINPAQLVNVRVAIEAVIETFAAESNARARMTRKQTVLDGTTVGQRLRQRREQKSSLEHASRRWLNDGSQVLCVSLGSIIDDLATEVLTRILRALRVDARHLSIAEFERETTNVATRPLVAMVYTVSAVPTREFSETISLVRHAQERLPNAQIIRVQLPEPLVLRDKIDVAGDEMGTMTESLEEAAQFAIARFPSLGVRAEA